MEIGRYARGLSLYGTAALALMVAMGQLYMRQKGLSSWKGGGFGMYAELHPVYTKLFIRTEGEQQRSGRADLTSEAYMLMEKAMIFPSNGMLEQLTEEVEQQTGVDELVVEVWEPVFDVETRTLELQLEKVH